MNTVAGNLSTSVGTVNRPNLKNVVAAQVRGLIFSGRLLPGARIDQEGLAVQLGVSKLPVREALMTLEQEGLINILPRRGAYVATLSRVDVADHYNLFGLVSGIAAERAATNLTDEELDALEGYLVAMEQGDESVRADLNFQFHRTINRASRSRRLMSVIGLLSNTFPPDMWTANEGWPEYAHKDHRRVLAALRARDGKAAREGMEAHLRAGAERAIQSLEKIGFWNEGDDPAAKG